MGTTLMDEPNGPGSKRTTIMGGGGGTELVQPIGSEGKSQVDDPVVGWLVVVDGPGKGGSIQLGYGMNIVGAARSNRIALVFGDPSISQEDHFRIAYDAENREFHLIPGRGTNLLYVGARPLLAPQPLPSGTDFKVGGTTLRFVALCGAGWDWSMAPDGTKA